MTDTETPGNASAPIDLAKAREKKKEKEQKGDPDDKKPTAETLWREYVRTSGRIAGELTEDGGIIPYIWSRTYWKPLPDVKSLKPVIDLFLSDKDGYYTSKNVSSCVNMTESQIQNYGRMIKRSSAHCYIALNNGVLEVENLTGKIRAHNPAHSGFEQEMKKVIVRSHVDTFIDWNRVDKDGYYQLRPLENLEDPNTRFGHLVRTCFPEEYNRSVAREFMGDTFSPIARKAFVLFIGSPDGGKSQILKVIGGIHSNKAAADLDQTSGFDLENFLGKQCIIIEELGEVMNEKTFKRLIGGSFISVKRKYMTTATISPDFKIIGAANKLSRIDENTGAVETRIYPLVVADYTGKVIHDIGRSIIDGYYDIDPISKKSTFIPSQADQVLEWCLHGLSAVYARGRTLSKEELPQSSQKIRKEMEEDGNLAAAWIDDVGCIPTGDYGDLVPKQVVFDMFKKWALQQNKSGIARISISRWGKELFGKAMAKKFGETWSGRERKPFCETEDGRRRVHCYPVKFLNMPKVTQISEFEARRSWNDPQAYDPEDLPQHVLDILEAERVAREKEKEMSQEEVRQGISERMQEAGFVEEECSVFGTVYALEKKDDA